MPINKQRAHHYDTAAYALNLSTLITDKSKNISAQGCGLNQARRMYNLTFSIVIKLKTEQMRLMGLIQLLVHGTVSQLQCRNSD